MQNPSLRLRDLLGSVEIKSSLCVAVDSEEEVNQQGKILQKKPEHRGRRFLKRNDNLREDRWFIGIYKHIFRND